MTPSDFDEPRMIWTGPLPPHLLRARETPEEASFDPPDAAAERPTSPVLAISAAAAVALVTGIAIGALTPTLLHREEVVAQKPAPAAAPTPPVVQAAAERAAPPAEELTTPTATAETPAVQAPRAAVAILPASHAATAVREKAETPVAKPCAGRTSAADRVVCTDPVVASADRDLQRAYQHAQASGAPAAVLHSDQIDWLLFRDEAAKRSPADLALAYRQRIDQLNSLADEPPH